MQKLTIYFPYYNNPDFLLKQLNNYATMSLSTRKNIHILIVDDGSSISKAYDTLISSKYKEKLNITLHRINIDIMWNTPEANNLAFKEAKTDYILRFDIDAFMTESEILKVINLKKKKGMYYTFKTQIIDFKTSKILDDNRPSYHPNMYLIHKDDYWITNGYNEYFSGNYGDDFEFKPRLNKICKVKYLTNIRLSLIYGIRYTDTVKRDTTINKKKLKENNRPHFTFKHKEHYELKYNNLLK